ncbi:MarR family transcriptional regulator [Hamadaea sp. NPDC050747]|uniref:MarR family winged helix-turn-helix transcriptional regulator n=1 Tax=Hamadaea sp. NPDC050747 TaxID=3155789 RepID=UPI0033E20ADF
MTDADAPAGLVLGGGSLLNQVGRELTTTTERLLAPLGLTSQQAALLLHASRGDAPGPSALRAALGTDTAGMTRLLDRLEDKGLLRRVRHPSDRRAVVIELTDAGRALLPRIPPVFGQVSRQVFAGFSASEVGVMTAMLQRMLTNLTA